MTRTAATALAALALSATAALAQPPAAPPAPTVVRGVVSALTDSSVTVKTDKGPQTVALTATWSVAVMKRHPTR